MVWVNSLTKSVPKRREGERWKQREGSLYTGNIHRTFAAQPECGHSSKGQRALTASQTLSWAFP